MLPLQALFPDSGEHGPEDEDRPMAMHYPRRVSKRKRARQFGFRARMKTRLGRKMINRKRRMKRRLTPS